MSLFNEMFGGGSVSKLFLNVREKKSLCYYCYSSLHSATGTIKVGCGIDHQKKDEAQSEIAAQLDAMKCGDFTNEEMETARKTLLSGIRQTNDSPASIEAFAFRRLLAGVSGNMDSCRDAIMNVTAEDVVRVADKVVLDTVYFLNGNGEEEECYEKI
jgi:predicted Zn-dependent peptidase